MDHPLCPRFSAFWALLRRRFPNAKIEASSLDAYAAHLLDNATLYASLPRFAGEMGDSWLYGSPADPVKLATFREAVRFTQQAVQKGALK